MSDASTREAFEKWWAENPGLIWDEPKEAMEDAYAAGRADERKRCAEMVRVFEDTRAHNASQLRMLIAEIEKEEAHWKSQMDERVLPRPRADRKGKR